ncbi:tRNA dihydrouridine synthase DusB [Granulosicoccaceae sp. 1_MG-2023]|nr:tRNA dihydrouridine synthase DusB [Granulosicoccaceae sp. 1_MG-2023]
MSLMQIGPYRIGVPLVLAPMAGITDAPFRAICEEQGAGLTVSEMISADTSLYASDKTRSRLVRQNVGERPHSVQIVGSEPAQIAQAAQLNVQAGAQIIDINMGCPAKKVCRKAAGSALLSDEPLVEAILRAAVAAVDVPVTLKIRTGPDRQNRNGVRVAKIAEDAGIAALTVHGRTRADRFTGEAEYDTIAAIVDAVSIPVIANGDIRSAADAVRVRDYTGAAAVMIGRAAQGNPWIFREAAAALQGLALPAPPDAGEIHRTLVRHLEGLYALHGQYRGVRIARKHIAWYCRERSGVAAFRNEINKIDSIEGQLARIDHFFSATECRAPCPPDTRENAA